MQVIRQLKWTSFFKWLTGYFQEKADRRRQLIFRGHRDAEWKLETTLDRFRRFQNDKLRNRFTTELIDEYRRELMHVDSAGTEGLKGIPMELLARHHGLPSPLMDWTLSPYVAAFFAFANCTAVDKRAAIWMLDRAKLPNDPRIEIIDDYSLLRFNQRAIRQRGVFVRVGTGKELEALVKVALTKITIPAREYHRALAELDEMTINWTYLFPDMDGAGRTALFRVALRS